MTPPHTIEGRTARGRTARADVPRASHAALLVPDSRDPVALLEQQASTLLPQLVPVRYARMLASPSAFLAGAAAVMGHDLAALPRTGLDVQLCGDAQLGNFGGYVSPERSFVFDLSDFDETLRGPFEWDLKRLAASFEVAGRSRGFDAPLCATAVREVVGSYRAAMRQFSGMRTLDVWHQQLDGASLEEELWRGHGAHVSGHGDRLRAFARLVEEVAGEPRLVSDPPFVVPGRELPDAAQLEARLRAILRAYRRTLPDDRRLLLDRYRYADFARTAVGVGGVGARCFVLLLLGRDGGDRLFLQVREAHPSVLERHLGRSPYPSSALRIVEGQRLLQAVTDVFLGCTNDFYVRQLWDRRAAVDLDAIQPRGLVRYGRICGWTLARAHARSGDCVAIAEYLGRDDAFDDAVQQFAVRYGDLTERDHAALAAAAATGRIAAARV